MPAASQLSLTHFPSCQRILILDQGHLVAFDTPSKLLEDPESHLSILVRNSGEEKELRALAAKAELS